MLHLRVQGTDDGHRSDGRPKAAYNYSRIRLIVENAWNPHVIPMESHGIPMESPWHPM